MLLSSNFRRIGVFLHASWKPFAFAHRRIPINVLMTFRSSSKNSRSFHLSVQSVPVINTGSVCHKFVLKCRRLTHIEVRQSKWIYCSSERISTYQALRNTWTKSEIHIIACTRLTSEQHRKIHLLCIESILRGYSLCHNQKTPAIECWLQRRPSLGQWTSPVFWEPAKMITKIKQSGIKHQPAHWLTEVLRCLAS